MRPRQAAKPVFPWIEVPLSLASPISLSEEVQWLPASYTAALDFTLFMYLQALIFLRRAVLAAETVLPPTSRIKMDLYLKVAQLTYRVSFLVHLTTFEKGAELRNLSSGASA